MGIGLAGAVLPLGADVSPVMARLSAYMAEAAMRPLPAEVIEKTKHHILDTLAAMISGAALPPGQVALKYAKARAGENTSTIVASKFLSSPPEAALVNAMLAHSDETDDSHAPSRSHPGCASVPAALAAGELFGVDGARLIRAVALGYDVGPRVTMTMGALAWELATHFSAHSIASCFSAGASAACVAGLNAQQMRWVLDYTAQQASGVAAWQRDTDHIEKSLVFTGFSTRNGVTAALLVEAGGTGVDDIFSGADNYLQAYAPKADPAGLVEKLGERYEITRTNIKKWTVGSPIQAPLDAIEIIQKKRPFEADQVKKVLVKMAASEVRTVNNREMPDICLQHMIAVMLMDKTASFAAAHDKPRMKDPAILKHRAKIEVVHDEEIERHIPNREAIIELTFADGSKASEYVKAVRGTPENPMPRAEVDAKCRVLIAPVLGAANTKKLVETIWGLETVQDVRALRPLLQA